MEVVKVMDNEKFGQFISEARKGKGLTQKELAKTLNVTDKAVSKWERGKSYPDISLLEPLGEALEVSIVELLKGEKTDKKENEQLILNAIYLYKKELKKKRKTIGITIGIILLISLSIILLVWYINKPKYSDDLAFVKWYIPGTENIKGNVDLEYFISKSPDFAIGANKYGYAVFINPDKAYERLIKDYRLGLDLIEREFCHHKVSKNDFYCYLDLGATKFDGTKEELEQVDFVSSFFDIYANSFSDEVIANMLHATPTSNTPVGRYGPYEGN